MVRQPLTLIGLLSDLTKSTLPDDQALSRVPMINLNVNYIRCQL
jgi:hypothetical protein